jgi:ABC-type glycerol-3-phosphate transport system substrate-binding protein
VKRRGTVARAIYVSTAGGVGLQTRQVGDKFKWTVLPPPIGPIGRHATQVSADGYALAKQTRYPDEAWEVVKLYASKEHGLKRFVFGFGSPGSRYDIWTDPEFKRTFPALGGLIYEKLIDPAKAPPLGVWHFPANGRYIEAITAINGLLEEVWLGNRKPAEAAAAAQSAGQAVVDKPPV